MKNKLMRLNVKSPLLVEDFANLSIDEVRSKICRDFEVDSLNLDRFQVLAAYMSEGMWGCDSSAWLLLRDRNSKALFEVHGSHCSCYGYEGQFTPELTSLEYLKSDKFGLSCGGYDNNEAHNKSTVVEFLKNL